MLIESFSKGAEMKPLNGRIVLILLAFLLAADVSAAENMSLLTKEDYVIGPGDVLEISVWKEESLTKRVTVLPDGKIAYPLIGEVVAGGWTIAQLKKEIETRLARFVPDPVLSVGVNQVNSMSIYVIGKVNNPGRFALNANVNVLQALAMAGGLNAFAKRSQIQIFRENGRKTEIYPFDYDEVSDGQKLEQNIQLVRGDVVVVR